MARKTTTCVPNASWMSPIGFWGYCVCAWLNGRNQEERRDVNGACALKQRYACETGRVSIYTSVGPYVSVIYIGKQDAPIMTMSCRRE